MGRPVERLWWKWALYCPCIGINLSGPRILVDPSGVNYPVWQHHAHQNQLPITDSFFIKKYTLPDNFHSLTLHSDIAYSSSQYIEDAPVTRARWQEIIVRVLASWWPGLARVYVAPIVLLRSLVTIYNLSLRSVSPGIRVMIPDI